MLWFIAFVLGVIIGSFVNVLVVRLAASEPMGGRSRCRSCGQQLAWHHNIPLLSFVWLKGRCAWCHQPICWQYPLVELATGLHVKPVLAKEKDIKTRAETLFGAARAGDDSSLVAREIEGAVDEEEGGAMGHGWLRLHRRGIRGRVRGAGLKKAGAVRAAPA